MTDIQKNSGFTSQELADKIEKAYKNFSGERMDEKNVFNHIARRFSTAEWEKWKSTEEGLFIRVLSERAEGLRQPGEGYPIGHVNVVNLHIITKPCNIYPFLEDNWNHHYGAEGWSKCYIPGNIFLGIVNKTADEKPMGDYLGHMLHSEDIVYPPLKRRSIREPRQPIQE